MIEYMLTDKAKDLLDKQGIDVSPVRGTSRSAGMDLSACIEEPITIYPGVITKIPTGLKIYLGMIPNDMKDLCTFAGFYLPRSSNADMVLANTVGLLDEDYQGESFLKVTARNNSFIIKPGERLAQLVIFPAVMYPWQEVSFFGEETERGEGGDGSTGR